MIITPKRQAKLFKFLKIKKLPYLPFSLGVETGNICNLKCPLCPTGLADKSMKKGFMDLALFQSIIGQLKNNLRVINLYSWGEPLLNPDLIAMIKYAKNANKKINIITSTNLNIQDDKLLEDLIKSGINEIIISCDGINQETYSQYRSGGNFNLLMRNMQYLISLQKQLNNKTILVWNYIVFRHNENDIEEAREMASSLGIALRISKMRTSMKEEILKPHSESIEKYGDWIPDRPEYSAYDKEKVTTKIKIKTCRKPWFELSVNWDGKVFPCCAVYGDEYNFGSIKEKNIREVWNNHCYIEARKEIMDKNINAKTICGICRNNFFMHM